MISSAAEGNGRGTLVRPEPGCVGLVLRVHKPRVGQHLSWCEASTVRYRQSATSSLTVIRPPAVARQLRSSTRDGSPRQRNHEAQISACLNGDSRGTDSNEELTAGIVHLRQEPVRLAIVRLGHHDGEAEFAPNKLRSSSEMVIARDAFRLASIAVSEKAPAQSLRGRHVPRPRSRSSPVVSGDARLVAAGSAVTTHWLRTYPPRVCGLEALRGWWLPCNPGLA